MSEGNDEKKIIIDSDWKEEAQREKERLADEETKEQAKGGAKALPEPSFGEILNMIVMQASIGLGGYQAPDGQFLPPDLSAAKHYIDMLELLDQKTAGNLEEEEKRILDQVIHELRMAFVQVTNAAKGIPQSENPLASQ